MKGRATAREVIEQDVYLINQYDIDYFDYVIDIGANKGWFTMKAAMLHPSAKIFSFEPAKSSFEHAKKFCDDLVSLRIVQIFQLGLGDGKKYKFLDRETVPSNILIENLDEVALPEDIAGERVQTLTLPQIVDQCEIDLNKKILFKCDCEGSEKFLLNPEASEIMKSFDHIGMEIHFNPFAPRVTTTRVAPRPTPLGIDLLDWEEYDGWISTNFGESFAITYHKSDARRGLGTYCLKSKK
jgi:FkbM family methyltransferase